MRAKKWGRWVRRAVAVVLVGALCLELSVVLLYQFPSDSSSQEADVVPDEWGNQDAVVCLAGASGRIPLAARVWAELASNFPDSPPKLYWSGVGPKSDLASLEAQYPSDLSPRPQSRDIILENLSRDTVENMDWILKLASLYHWKKIVLVTSRYHLKRAQFLLRTLAARQGSTLAVQTIALDVRPFTPWTWLTSWSAIRLSNIEAIKYFYYRLIWPWVAPRES